MYLNLVQIAESFGVSEGTVEDWIRSDGLPHVPERGRLLFDRTQVADWAAARGLTARAGFLAASDPALATSWQLEALLRRGGIWRDVDPQGFRATLGRIIEALPASSAVRDLVRNRIASEGGLTLAPVGHGFALPHPSARIALGRAAGVVALLMLRAPLTGPDAPADDVPVTRLLFFLAPTPRAHLDLLGRLSRVIAKASARERMLRPAGDDEIFGSFAEADAAAARIAPAATS